MSNYNFNPLAGASVTATLSSGQTISEASTATYTTEPFFGFTSGTPIQSLTLTAPSAIGNTAAYISMDNLLVGPATVVTAPEPATCALLIGGCVLLVGLARVRQEALA